MIVEEIRDDMGGPRYLFHRETLWEWFRFPVSPVYYSFRSRGDYLPIPAGYRLVYQDRNRAVDWYFFAPLKPFVLAWMWITRRWIMASYWCYRRGWYPHESGEMVPINWPIRACRHLLYSAYATITKSGQTHHQK